MEMYKNTVLWELYINIYHTYTHTYVYAIILKRFIDSCHLISDLVNCLQFDGLWPVLKSGQDFLSEF